MGLSLAIMGFKMKLQILPFEIHTLELKSDEVITPGRHFMLLKDLDLVVFSHWLKISHG